MAEYRVCTSCERRESEMRSLRSEVERLGRENDRLTHWIASEGYVTCDIPACNCPWFHGGHASNRLMEVNRELGDLTQGKTILHAVTDLMTRAESLATELAAAKATIENYKHSNQTLVEAGRSLGLDLAAAREALGRAVDLLVYLESCRPWSEETSRDMRDVLRLIDSARAAAKGGEGRKDG